MMRKAEGLFANLVVWVVSYASAKIWNVRGVSNHLVFMGKWPTVIHTILALSTKWTSSPSRKQGRAISSRYDLVVLVIGVNQEI